MSKPWELRELETYRRKARIEDEQELAQILRGFCAAKFEVQLSDQLSLWRECPLNACRRAKRCADTKMACAPYRRLGGTTSDFVSLADDLYMEVLERRLASRAAAVGK